jgi:hypothetical protein
VWRQRDRTLEIHLRGGESPSAAVNAGKTNPNARQPRIDPSGGLESSPCTRVLLLLDQEQTEAHVSWAQARVQADCLLEIRDGGFGPAERGE